MTYLWWEIDAGIPELVERDLIERSTDEDGTPHFRLTEEGVWWSLVGDRPEECKLP